MIWKKLTIETSVEAVDLLSEFLNDNGAEGVLIEDNVPLTEDELKEAAVQVKCKFASFDGCMLQSLRYAGDECNTEENIKWLNSLDEGAEYTKVAEFLMDFHTPKENSGAFDADKDMKDYQWWLAQDSEGSWQVVSFGY